MPVFRTERRVGHPAGDMFDLVADVERYPEFVPMCTALKVRRRERVSDEVERIVADMEVGYKAIREKFTSRVTLDKPNLKILVEYIDGPFSKMDNRWTFRDEPSDAGPASTVEFYISYEFRSRMLGMLMGTMFDAAFRKFSAAFEARADQIYGKRRLS
jgi:coenzyme Q-binding protein COQ10